MTRHARSFQASQEDRRRESFPREPGRIGSRDAAAAKPPLIPFNPAVRPRNRGRRTGRKLDRAPKRAWATPLEVLLVAERAALLDGRDDEFTRQISIAYTGMRWGETTGLGTTCSSPS